MATAGDIVNRALRIINIAGVGQAISAEEMQEGLAALRDMMASWELEGVRLGAFVGTDLTTTTTIPLPASHMDAIQALLAKRLSPEYGRAPDPILMERAGNGWAALQAAYLQVPVCTVDPALRGTYGWPRGYYDV